MGPNPGTNIVSPITIPTNTFAKIVQGHIPEPHISNIKQNKITPTLDHSTVTMSRNPSLQPALTKPIKVDQLAKYLWGFDASLHHFLIHGFKFGFKIPFQGIRQFCISKNLPSLKGKEDILYQKLKLRFKLIMWLDVLILPRLKIYKCLLLDLYLKTTI